MAKAKQPTPSKKPVEAASKAKVGPVSRAMIQEALEKLKSAEDELASLDAAMESRKLNEIVLEGPKLLPRGVNGVMQFVLKLDAALRRMNRM